MKDKIIKFINKKIENKLIQGFRAEYILKKYSISQQEFDDIMNELINQGKIKLVYEVKCDCLNTVTEVTNVEEILDTDIECSMCGEEFEVKDSNIYPYYKVNR